MNRIQRVAGVIIALSVSVVVGAGDASNTPDPERPSLPVAYISHIEGGFVVAVDVVSDSIVSIKKTGTSPAETAAFEAAGHVYVADLTDGTVAVVNVANHRIVHTINLGSPVATVGINESTGIVYALDFSNGTAGTNLHVIEAATNTEIDDVAIGTRLQNLTVHAGESRVFATDFVDGVIVVETTDHTVATTIPMANSPHGIAVNPATNRLYVTQLDSDTVEVIDTVSLGVTATLSVGDRPQWIALDPLRNRAFVTNEGDGTVSVIDTVSDTVLPFTIPVGASPLTVTVRSAAGKAYVYNIGDGSISVIDTTANAVITTIDLGFVVFADGFEWGDTTAWSVTLP
jgi:YVTN family beta-propeller protein